MRTFTLDGALPIVHWFSSSERSEEILEKLLLFLNPFLEFYPFIFSSLEEVDLAIAQGKSAISTVRQGSIMRRQLTGNQFLQLQSGHPPAFVNHM